MVKHSSRKQKNTTRSRLHSKSKGKSRLRKQRKQRSSKRLSSAVYRKKMTGGENSNNTSEKLKEAIDALTVSLKNTLSQCKNSDTSDKKVYYGGHYLNKFMSSK